MTEFGVISHDDQEAVEAQFVESAHKAMIDAQLQPAVDQMAQIREHRNRRSEGGKRAAATRKANAAKVQPQPSVDAEDLRNAIQRVFEKREEVTAIMAELAHMESELDRLINRITYSKP